MKKQSKMRVISLSLILFLLIIVVVPTKSTAAQQTVNLGTSSRFAVLAGSTITNTGTTTIDGTVGADIGLYPGTAFDGRTNVTISGGEIHMTDTNASKAKDDLLTAYNDAAGRPLDVTIAADLGGTTLSPGTYKSESSIQITGTLTLDAMGDPEAIFVFQAGSTLTTASYSTINLVNGAQFSRVFWQVGSSATLGTYSHFEGHILAMESITANTGAKIMGQLLAQNGAVTLDSNSISNGINIAIVTPTPMIIPTPIITPTPMVTPTPTVTPAVTPTVTPTPTITPTPTVTPTPILVIAAPTTAPGTVTGGQLPKTATPWYNVFLAGTVLTLVGGIMAWSNRKH